MCNTSFTFCLDDENSPQLSLSKLLFYLLTDNAFLEADSIAAVKQSIFFNRLTSWENIFS